MYEVDYVHYDYLDVSLPKVEFFLRKAVDGSIGGEYTYDELIRELRSGDQILWVVYRKDSKEVVAAATAAIVTYPSGLKAVQFVMVGGTDAKDWFGHLTDAVTVWGRAVGATRVEGIGRRGWVRKFLRPEGYRELYMTFAKEI